ncbi:MAG: ABC transporter permease [Christensenella sp.]|uniref:ABC transporter permease n=1 Tax=Christensenella sp. TaxID=1935934 RepID=UPI002B20FE45|nr:ABC transporter permease [Christensenella sp.]MEA5004195.1 ABC transporter permease [Christensenella sp.]
MMAKANAVKEKKGLTTELFLVFIIVAYCIIVSIVNPEFLNAATLFDMVKSAAPTMVVAMGLLLVVISGGIDVSFTAIAIFGGYVATTTLMATGVNNILVAFLISCAVGLVLGLINAVLIHVTKMEPFIITLATSGLYQGFLLTFIGTKNIGSVDIPKAITEFGNAKLFAFKDAFGSEVGLSVFIIIIVAVILLTWFILHRTMLGKSIFALGCSPEAARRAGFNIWKTHLFVYGYMGVLSGIMGMLYIAGINACNPVTLVGTELTIVAAVIIGGARVSGGQGTILGTILGVVIMYLLNTTLIFLGLSSSWNDLFLGVILIFSIVMTSWQERKKNRKMFIFTE